jgi:hypothetical protein
MELSWWSKSGRMDRRAEAPMIKGTYNNKERASGRGREGESNKQRQHSTSQQPARTTERAAAQQQDQHQHQARTGTSSERVWVRAGEWTGLDWTGGVCFCGDGRTVTARENGQGLLTLSFPRLDAPARSSRDKIWAVL